MIALHERFPAASIEGNVGLVVISMGNQKMKLTLVFCIDEDEGFFLIIRWQCEEDSVIFIELSTLAGKFN